MRNVPGEARRRIAIRLVDGTNCPNPYFPAALDWPRQAFGRRHAPFRGIVLWVFRQFSSLGHGVVHLHGADWRRMTMAKLARKTGARGRTRQAADDNEVVDMPANRHRPRSAAESCVPHEQCRLLMMTGSSRRRAGARARAISCRLLSLLIPVHPEPVAACGEACGGNRIPTVYVPGPWPQGWPARAPDRGRSTKPEQDHGASLSSVECLGQPQAPKSAFASPFLAHTHIHLFSSHTQQEYNHRARNHTVYTARPRPHSVPAVHGTSPEHTTAGSRPSSVP